MQDKSAAASGDEELARTPHDERWQLGGEDTDSAMDLNRFARLNGMVYGSEAADIGATRGTSLSRGCMI